jgi:hypothetical protein
LVQVEANKWGFWKTEGNRFHIEQPAFLNLLALDSPVEASVVLDCDTRVLEDPHPPSDANFWKILRIELKGPGEAGGRHTMRIPLPGPGQGGAPGGPGAPPGGAQVPPGGP